MKFFNKHILRSRIVEVIMSALHCPWGAVTLAIITQYQLIAGIVCLNKYFLNLRRRGQNWILKRESISKCDPFGKILSFFTYSL